MAGEETDRYTYVEMRHINLLRVRVRIEAQRGNDRSHGRKKAAETFGR